MTIAIKKMFAQILFWLYELLDTIFEMFQVLCGIQKVSVEGEDGSKSLLNIFLESNAVTRAFFLIMLVAVLVAGLATITAVVKNIVNLKGGERKSHVKTLGQGFGTIIVTLVMALIMIIFVSLSGEVLNSVSKATSPDMDSTFSNELFGMSVGKTYQWEYVPVYETDENGEKIQETDDNGNLVFDNDNEPVFKIKKDSDGDIVYEKQYKKDDKGNPIFTTGWQDGEQNIDFSKATVDEVFGVRNKNMVGFEKEDSAYKRNPKVELESFNFLTAYLSVLVMIVALVFSMLGLVKRVFDIVMLFITLPLVSATIPLDDGARFKSWRDTVLSKVVLAYGAVLSVNVFLLIMPIINNLQFEDLGWGGFIENLFKIFLMMGGALSINGGQLLLARLMGTSADESREMAHSARALLGGAGAVGGVMRGIKNTVLGGTNKYGRQRVGALNWGARLGTLIGEKSGKGEQFQNSFGGKAMRWAGRLPKLQKPDAMMQSMAGNIGSIADILAGGKGGNTNNNAISNIAGQSSPANLPGNQPSEANGLSGLVSNVLSNGASNNAFTKPDDKK